MQFSLHVCPERLLRRLLGVCFSLTAVSIACSYLYLQRGRSLRGLAILFLLEEDTSVPTWFAAAQLAGAAAVLATLAARDRLMDRVVARGWALLSVVFALLSIDEVATLHEWAGDVIGARRGYFYYSWVILGAVVVGIVGLLSLPLLRRLPRRTRTLIVLSGAVFVSGALLMEMVNGRLDDIGSSDLHYSLQSAVEEAMELCGASLFLYALTDYGRSVRPSVAAGILEAGRMR